MSKIISIGTAVPEYGTQQTTILEFMQAAYNDETASRKLKLLFNHSGISIRHSVIPDFDNRKSDPVLFNREVYIPNVGDRSKIFKDHAVPLAIAAIKDSLNKLNISLTDAGITHLITVTCTGLIAPGIDAVIMEQLDLPRDIFHTSFNFLGCNAAFPALKLADMIVTTDANARILIVCVELCTIHFQPKNNHDNLLSNTIFGDGAAAVIVTSDTDTKFKSPNNLMIKGFFSLLLDKGKDLMGWNITPVNFEMVLDAKVPEFIGNEVDDIIFKAGRKLNITTASIDKWAIHPGGKKILDTIKNQLHLSDSDLQCSYKVLDQYGNMSSPTILFVLNEIMHAPYKKNETIFSIGFGPGLSIETALFTLVPQSIPESEEKSESSTYLNPVLTKEWYTNLF
jgi:predicted naringenin-chalcone synthase